MTDENFILPLKTSLTAGAHVCRLCNKVSISKGIAAVCSSKPSSTTEMLIQDVGLRWRMDFKPNGTGTLTEDMTWQLAHGINFSRWFKKNEETMRN